MLAMNAVAPRLKRKRIIPCLWSVLYICHNTPVSHTVHLLHNRIMYTCMGSVSVCRYIYTYTMYTYRVVGTCIPVLAASSTSTNNVYKTKIHCTVIVVPCQDLYMCYTYLNMYILYIYTCMSSSRITFRWVVNADLRLWN